MHRLEREMRNRNKADSFILQSATRRSERVLGDDLTSEQRSTHIVEYKEKEERISLEKNFPFPKITAFS